MPIAATIVVLAGDEAGGEGELHPGDDLGRGGQLGGEEHAAERPERRRRRSPSSARMDDIAGELEIEAHPVENTGQGGADEGLFDQGTEHEGTDAEQAERLENPGIARWPGLPAGPRWL